MEESDISVIGERTNDHFAIRVSNMTLNPPKDDSFLQDNFTTKDGHEGQGLSIVRHLLSAHRGAELSYRVDDVEVEITVTLPVGG